MATPELQLSLSNDSGEPAPDPDAARRWLQQALQLAGHTAPAEIAVKVISAQEMQTLNRHYRGQDKPTNVLSFPAGLPVELQLPLLGDIAICAAVVEHEAQQQHKPAQAHWAHMLVHGCLHLLGYDHQTETEAAHMEALETRIMLALQFSAPYDDNTQL